MTTFQQKVKLLQGLLMGEIAHTRPFYATVDVTCRCNIHCVCCLYHSSLLNIPSDGNKSYKRYSLRFIQKVVQCTKSDGYKSNNTQWRRRTFSSSMSFDLISVAKDAGFHVMLYTNGTYLTKPGSNIL